MQTSTMMIATACCLLTASGGVRAQSVEKETLLQSDHAWNGSSYPSYASGQPQLTMLKLTIAPHTTLPWHTHPEPNAAYILSGSLTVQDRVSGKSKTFHAGQAFAETVNDEHRGVNDGDEPTVVVVTYAGVVGMPTSVPAKGEKSEY